MDSDSNVYEQICDQIQKGDQEFENIQEKNKVFFSVYQDKYNLGAYTLIPRDLLNRNQKILNENLILITLIMLAVVSISFYFVSRLLSRPLEEMTKTVKRIQGGETQLRMENLRNDEVGELGKSFNNMLDQIEKLIADEYENKMSLNYARYQALQAQINPHFLYNTLDSIIWMAEGKKNEEVVLMTASLARLLRQSISIENELVTIGQEVEYVRSYLTIQKMRYKDKLEFEINVDPRITHAQIIRLVLQPIVENAIYHGLKYKESKGMLKVHGYELGERIIIDITDDGVGMDEETLKHIYDKHKVNYHSNGVGVYNVQQRLVLYYGKEYGIIYHSEKGKGTTATVVIPKKQEDVHEKI